MLGWRVAPCQKHLDPPQDKMPNVAVNDTTLDIKKVQNSMIFTAPRDSTH